MEVDQKHVTTIRLHDAKGGDIRLVKDGRDFELRLCSDHNVVSISLGFHDVRKLWQQIVQLDVEENWKATVPAPENKSFLFGSTPRTFQETMAQLFTRMAQEMCEVPSKR